MWCGTGMGSDQVYLSFAMLDYTSISPCANLGLMGLGEGRG